MLQIVRKIYHLGFRDDFMALAIKAVPLILTGLSQIFITITSIFFCGHLGAVPLAACSMSIIVKFHLNQPF